MNPSDNCEEVTKHDTWEDFDKYFKARYVDNGVFVGGCTVVVCNAEGVVHRVVYGEHKQDTVYAVNSISKIVLSVACLQLRDQGKLDLDDPVSRYLPLWDDTSRPAEPGVNLTPITIRQTLNHTSGLGFYVFDACRSPLEKSAGTQKWKLMFDTKTTLAKYVEWIGKSAPALFQPGQHFNYADGVNAVARIIEIVSGLELADYYEQNIFGPLGMNETTFFTTVQQKARYPTQKCPSDATDVIPWWARWAMPSLVYLFPYDFNQSSSQGGRGDGGLKGPIDDWVKFNCCLLNAGEWNGVRILSAASVAEMCSSSVGGKELVPPFAYQRGAKVPLEAPPAFGLHPSLLDEVVTKQQARAGNHWPGQTIGLCVNIVQDPEKAALLDQARGLSWWCGAMATYFGFHTGAKLGIMVYGAHGNPWGKTRMAAFRDAVNASFYHQTCK